MDPLDPDDVLDLLGMPVEACKNLRKFASMTLHKPSGEWTQREVQLFPDLNVPSAREYVSSLTEKGLQVLKLMFRELKDLKEVESMEQRTPGWFAGRFGRVSSSTVAGLTGYDEFAHDDKDVTSREMLGLLDKNFSKPQLNNMNYGTLNEDRAVEEFEQQTRVRVRELVSMARSLDKSGFKYGDHEFALPTEEQAKDDSFVCNVVVPGFKVHPLYQWLGDSADGLVYILGSLVATLEVKCPSNKNIYPMVPLRYMDQIQVHMLLWNSPSNYFYTWSSKQQFCDVHRRDAAYVWRYMIPVVRKFFFEVHLPNMIVMLEKDPEKLLKCMGKK